MSSSGGQWSVVGGQWGEAASSHSPTDHRPPTTDHFPGGGHVVGVGVDLVDVGRIRLALARHGARLTNRVLSESEATYCLSRPDPAPHIAARFAAKEAVIKCLGGGCSLKEIQVVRALSGSPSITLSGRAKERAGACQVLISLSHLENLAAAFAVLVVPDDASPSAAP